MLETIKNAFIDKDDGSFKLGSIAAAVVGGIAGSMLLAPLVAFLPMAGLIAPLLGAAAAVAAKEAFFPSSSASDEQAQHAAPGGQDVSAQGHGHSQHMEPEVPNVPNHSAERER